MVKKSMIGLGVLGVGVAVLSLTTGPNLHANISNSENSENSGNSQTSDTNSKEHSESDHSGGKESQEETSTTDLSTTSSELPESTSGESATQTETETETAESTENSTFSSEDQTSESTLESSSSSHSSETSTTIHSSAPTENTSTSSTKEVSTEKDTESTQEKPNHSENLVIQPPVSLPSISDLIPDDAPGAQYLPENLKTNQIAKDSLAGFELPLLSSYRHPHQGVLVYEAIKNISEKQEKIDTATFIEQLFEKLINQKVADLKAETIDTKKLLAGDVLYVEIDGKYQLLGLYLGDAFYVSIDEEKVGKDKKELEYAAKVKKVYLSEEEKVQVIRADQTKLTKYGKEVLADYPASFDFQPNLVTQRLIDTIGEDARDLGLKYDVFASVMIAQAILESGGGTSALASAPYYNLFGMKGQYRGNSVTFSTSEDMGNGQLFEIKSAFRAYPNQSSSLSDYVQLIRGGIAGNADFYEDSWRSSAKNYLRATHELTGKYATDTYYHKKLNSIIAAYHLTTYDQAKISETGLFIEGLENVPKEYKQLMIYPVYDGKDYNTSGSYPVGQCTWYAFNRVSQLGMKVDDFMGNGGEWASTGRRLGYEISSVPKAGTLISFTPGTAGSSPRYGHVAFVEAVGPNGILISEGNVYGGDTISYRVIDNELAYSALVSYVTPKN
ncbi:glucosaminidase domain-containing protein [Enterococcus sp. LJL98]